MKHKALLFLGIVAAAVVVLLCLKAVFFKRDINVLLITMDTTRADHLGCYGYDKNTTPHIDAFASENVLFTSAVSSIPFTFPSHLTIMTGTLPIYHCSHDNDGKTIGDWHLTLAEVLKEQGYKTGAILASYVLNAKFGLNQGFDVYQEFDDKSKGTKVFTNGRRALETARLANQWFQENKDAKFFLFAHFYDPHFPYDPPEPFVNQFDDPYDGEIASVDQAIGQMLDKLKELDIYDNTMIIIEADHGEMLGQHGEAGHGYYIYEGAVRVPLIVKLPGSHKPRKVSDTVGLVDIFPTVCGVLGIEVPDFVQGRNLGPCFEGKHVDEERYLYTESLTATKFGGNSLLGVVKSPYKYIQTTRPELYNVLQDCAEENNLVDEDPKRARFMQGNLKDVLDTYTKAVDTEKPEADLATRKQLESLGYIGGEVDASLSFDQSKPDPKDIKYLHTMYRKASNYSVVEDWANARIWCAKLLKEKPDLKLAQMTSAQIWLGRIKAEPDKAKAYEEVGDVFFKAKEYKRAIEVWNEALKLEVDTPGLHKKLAAANLDLGNTEEAIKQLHISLDLDPAQADVYLTLGNIADDGGERQQALTYWGQSLGIDPAQPKLHDTLAKAYYQQDKLDKVVRHWSELARLQPDNARVCNNLAWLFAAARDPAIRDSKLALEYALRACELTDYQHANFVDTLAVAQAAGGQFSQAIEMAQKALELAIDSGQEELVDEINKRLALYKTNQPYYDK